MVKPVDRIAVLENQSPGECRNSTPPPPRREHIVSRSHKKQRYALDDKYIMFMRQTHTHTHTHPKGKRREGSPAERRDPMNLSRGRITVAAKDGGS